MSGCSENGSNYSCCYYFDIVFTFWMKQMESKFEHLETELCIKWCFSFCCLLEASSAFTYTHNSGWPSPWHLASHLSFLITVIVWQAKRNLEHSRYSIKLLSCLVGSALLIFFLLLFHNHPVELWFQRKQDFKIFKRGTNLKEILIRETQSGFKKCKPLGLEH